VSTTCIAQLRAAAASLGLPGHDPSYISSFACDSTDPSASPSFRGVDADALLIMFTLSAVTPPQQHEMLLNARAALRPGGRLLLRDHGLYDMVQLRIPPEQCTGIPNQYKRGDGTLAYFFAVEGLSDSARRAGLEVEECKYICVKNINKKTGVELRRVFVHLVARRPL
jgi:methyltransferase-like protein 6